MTTLVSFAYLCRERIGGPWIGQGVPLRDARRASPEVGRGQMDEDTLSRAQWWWGFCRPAVHQEDQQGGSSGPFRLGEGDNHTHCQNCRIRVGLFGCWFSWQHLWVLHIFAGRGLEGHGLGKLCQWETQVEQVQKSGEGADGRGCSVSSLMMMIFSTSSPPRRSARRLVRTIQARGRGQPYSSPKLYNPGLFGCLISRQHLWVLHIFAGRGLAGYGLGEVCQWETQGEQVQKSGEGPDGRGYSAPRARWWCRFFRPAVHQEDQQGGSSGPFRLGEGDNHTHCQNCTIKACLVVCSRDNTCEFCISL